MLSIHKQLMGVAKAVAPARTTGHQVSKLIQAKLGLNVAEQKKVKRWWERRMANENMTPYEDLELYLAALGYELKIVRKKGRSDRK